jgi:hypothetical protein
MSAPKTNLEKQKRRHWAPLLGMALVALFGVALIVYWQVEEAAGQRDASRSRHRARSRSA